jgi:hypothetical protein
MVVDDDDGDDDDRAFIHRVASGDFKQIFWISVAFLYFTLFYPQALMVTVIAMMIEHYLMDHLNRCKTARSRENPYSSAAYE